jgi:hypothetical protein
MNNEFEKIWKEAVVAQFKLLHQHFPGWTKENHEIQRQDSGSPGRDLHSGGGRGPPRANGGDRENRCK